MCREAGEQLGFGGSERSAQAWFVMPQAGPGARPAPSYHHIAWVGRWHGRLWRLIARLGPAIRPPTSPGLFAALYSPAVALVRRCADAHAQMLRGGRWCRRGAGRSQRRLLEALHGLGRPKLVTDRRPLPPPFRSPTIYIPRCQDFRGDPKGQEQRRRSRRRDGPRAGQRLLVVSWKGLDLRQ